MFKIDLYKDLKDILHLHTQTTTVLILLNK